MVKIMLNKINVMIITIINIIAVRIRIKKRITEQYDNSKIEQYDKYLIL